MEYTRITTRRREKKKVFADRKSRRSHLVSRVHVLRVRDRRYPSERLQGLPAVQPARADTHRGVELVLVHLSVEKRWVISKHPLKQKNDKSFGYIFRC